MAIKGLVGAVYENDTVPLSDNIALLFNWVLEVEHRKVHTFGPEMHGILTGWHVTVDAYWALEDLPRGQFCVRLFIGKGKDKRCLTGKVEMPTLQKTDDICETELILQGVGLICLEGYRSEERSP